MRSENREVGSSGGEARTGRWGSSGGEVITARVSII
jgi:hypothetical protein